MPYIHSRGTEADNYDLDSNGAPNNHDQLRARDIRDGQPDYRQALRLHMSMYLGCQPTC